MSFRELPKNTIRNSQKCFPTDMRSEVFGAPPPILTKFAARQNVCEHFGDFRTLFSVCSLDTFMGIF